MSRRGKLIFVCFLLGVVCALFQTQRCNPAQAAPDETARFRAGLRNSPGRQRLNADQLDQVLLSLREKTGWQSLEFDAAGFLVCSDPRVFSGGSESARRLLGAAIFGGAVYELEAHNGSLAVAFARLADGANYESVQTGARISAHSLQIDFADFRQLRGEGPAIKAFDLGLLILHELAHGVWRLRDAAYGEEGPGECEAFINQIRRELRLPERQNYFARALPGASNRAQPIAELLFVRTLEKQGQARREKFRLRWEAATVGPITDLSLIKARRRAETGKLVYAPYRGLHLRATCGV